MIPFFSKKKNLSPEEVMFEIEKKSNKSIKGYIKNKKLARMTKEEEILDDLLESLLELFHDFAFKTKIIIIGYSDNKSFKKDLIDTHNYLSKFIINNKSELNTEKIKDLKNINTSIFLNGSDDIYEAVYIQAKIVQFKNKLENYYENDIDLFKNTIIQFSFIENYFIMLCNNIKGLEEYFKNEFR